jgi:hypothetical protein
MRYVLGNGKTGIKMGSIQDLDIPFIQFETLENPLKIGSDIPYEVKGTNETMIIIKNLEGLAVLEYLIKKVKKQLKQQNKKL